MSSPVPEGKIITFYSYKGGTGRSMALANVAWILASNGKRVLTLDWDMEAPGLHRYFYPFLYDKDLSASDGLIDFVIKFATAAAMLKPDVGEASTAQNTSDGLTHSDPSPAVAEVEENWYEPYSNILRYATSVNWKFDNGGTLDFIPSGRQGPSYGTRVNSFNWKQFYEKLGGGTLLEMAKDKMRAEYDYILIDSRTGVSDTSGICTVQMPDMLVICFTLNNQSVEGALAVANAVFEQRTHSALVQSTNGHPQAGSRIQIFPVPMRVENAEKVKLQTRKDYAKERFRYFPNSIPGEERELYWGNIPVLYVPYYAYEEILSPFGDNSADRISILAAAEQLTSYLTGGEVTKLPQIADEERQRILTQYETGAVAPDPSENENSFAEHALRHIPADDHEFVRRVFTRLVRVADAGEVGGDTALRINVSDIEAPDSQVLRQLIDSSLVRKEYDFRGKKEMVTIGQPSLLRNWRRLNSWLVIDRNFLLWRQRLNTKIDEWEKNKKDKGALLSGTLLDEAQKWHKEKANDLYAAEISYIKESARESERLKEEQQETQRTRQLIQRAKWGVGILIVVIVVAVYTALNPLVTESKAPPPVVIQHDAWILSDDRTVAISFSRDKTSHLWRPQKQRWDEKVELGVPFERIVVSPTAEHIAGKTSDNRVFVWRVDDKLAGDAKPVLTLPKLQTDAQNRRASIFSGPGFSPDGKWVYTFSSSGLYLWRVGDALGDNPPPYLSMKVSTDPFDEPPNVVFSKSGKFMAVVDSDGNLFVHRLNPPPGIPSTSFIKVSDGTRGKASFSDDEEWLAITRAVPRDRKTQAPGKLQVFITNLNRFPEVNVQPGKGIDLESDPFNDEAFRIYFSPDSRWVFAKIFGDLYAWRINESPGSAMPVVKHDSDSQSEYGESVEFSPDEKWVGARASDRSIYIWELGKTGDGQVKPVIPRDKLRMGFYAEDPDFKFGPVNDWVAGNAADGRVFVWKAGSDPDLMKPLAFLGTGDINYDWCLDEQLFVFGGGNVYFGKAGQELDLIHSEQSTVVGITQIPESGSEELTTLVVFGERNISFVKKKLYFWRIPIRTYPWPALAKGK